MITDGQVRKFWRDLATGRKLAVAARRAGMDEKTARKYRQGRKLPSMLKRPRAYRTRKDPFADVWPQVETLLENEAALQAKTLFDWVKKQYPGKFDNRHRRTFERRVHHWRVTRGPAQNVMFSQVHHAGDLGASDFTELGSLGITITGQRFAQLAYHFVLTYSNWETITLCASESFEALSEGLQSALWELGGVPRRHRSDSLTAAVNNLSVRREFQARYQALLDHYGLAGERINVRQPHENGDSESSHGHFKNAVDQALYLRGSRDFANHDELLAFLRDIVAERNAPRRARYEEELAMLQPLPEQRLDSCLRVKVGVDPGSLIRIHRNVYSVHSRLIGEEVEARLYADRVEVWHAGRQVDTLPRLVGRDKHAVNYRHIIDRLVRKPGAFENYRYREDLFPNSRFRLAYDRLCEEHTPAVGTRAYLRILQEAARENESAVDDALRQLLLRDEPLSAETVIAMAQQSTQLPAPTAITVELPDLREFDGLLQHKEVYDVEACCPSTFAAVGSPCGTAEFPADGQSTADSGAVGGDCAAAERSAQGTAVTDVPRALPSPGGSGSAGVPEPPPVPGGAGELRVPDAEPQPDPAADAQLTLTAWQDVGAVSVVACAAPSGPAVPPLARGDLPGPPRECPGIWETGLGEDAHFVRTGGPTGPAGSYGVVRHLQLSGAGIAGGQTRVEAQPPDQETGGLPGLDHRRLGVCAAEPRRDGGLVHALGRALRAWQRAADEQPAVFTMGADLQGSHDHSGSDRPIGTPQRDRRVEHPQLSAGGSRECARADSSSTIRGHSSVIHVGTTVYPGNLIVAKAEI